MPIAAAALETHPRFFFAFRQGARLLLEIHDSAPKLAGLFSSQQRWLMSHAAFALACSRDPADPASGLYAARFISLVIEKQVASKNTAADFIQELLLNGFVRVVSGHEDRRRKLLEATETPDAAMSQWLELHLAGLDGIDGGRVSRPTDPPPAYSTACSRKWPSASWSKSRCAPRARPSISSHGQISAG